MSVALGAPDPIEVIRKLVQRTQPKIYRKLHVKMLVYPGPVLIPDVTASVGKTTDDTYLEPFPR